MQDHNYYVYILTSERNGVFYTGITRNLIKRVYQHKEKIISGFTKKYNVTTLVYYEHFHDVLEAIKREKVIKKWKRKYKISAIESINPTWRDLYDEII